MFNKKILAFDTTNNTVSVAISHGENILAYREELTPSMQAESLLPMINVCLADAGLSYQEIEYLAVTNGPGSFTGIRIGLSAAKALLLSTKMQGGAVSNFIVHHFRTRQQISKDYDRIFIILYAHRNLLYMQEFYNDDIYSEPLLLDYEEAFKLIMKSAGTKIACGGNGLEAIYDKIKDLPGIMVLPRFSRIKALHICRYIASKGKNTNPEQIEPFYSNKKSLIYNPKLGY